MKAGSIELEFIRKIPLNENTYEFHFKKPRGFKFIPGQYLKISLPVSNPDMRGSSRHFTISSSPKDKDLTITTRIIRSSFKMHLNELKEGEVIKAFGPIGYFTFDLKSKKTKIFLAGGIGLTPYRSLLRSLDGKKGIQNIYLFISFPSKNESVYLEELKELEQKNPFIIIYTFTRKFEANFEKGRITKELIAKYIPDYKDAEFFIVGSEEVEQAFLKLVKSMSVVEKNIFSENFPGY